MAKKILLPALFVLSSTVALLSGCGGGGGGGGGSAPPTTLTVIGTITNSSGDGLPAAKIEEMPADISATTNSNGAYSLTLPASVSEQTVTFDFYNASDQLQLVQLKKINASAGQTFSLGATAIGPPPPP